MEQLVKQALWLSFWDPKDVPTVQWRIAAPQPREAERPNFTLKQSTDCEQRQCELILLPLKPVQQHTFGWMLKQEQGIPFLSEQVFRRRLGATDLSVEVNINRHFVLRGGILGDTMGYGKTACMIALIRETVDDLFGSMSSLADDERAQVGKRVLTNATLIIVPKNLFRQWAEEIRKFAPDLTVLEIGTYSQLKFKQARDLMKVDVVLVTFEFFFSQSYRVNVDKQVFSVQKRGEWE